DDGEVHDIASEDVNDYIREAAGGEFTAKDVRTWAGTVLAFRELRGQTMGGGRATRRNLVAAIRTTGDRLGNTPAVARGSYVDPAVGEAYLEGRLASGRVRGSMPTRAKDSRSGKGSATRAGPDLPDRHEELALLRLLRAARS